MTKEQIKQTSIMPSENDNTCNEIKPITYATLQELQNSGACVMLFNATGRKVGNILNRQLTFFNTLRPTAGVLLYTMTNKDGHIQTGKVIIR
jgi:hypothetical protein